MLEDGKVFAAPGHAFCVKMDLGIAERELPMGMIHGNLMYNIG